MTALRDFATQTPSWVYLVGWVLWIVWFAILETWALLDRDSGDTFTEHVRPIVQATSVGWFLAAGLLLWLVWHFLVEQ